MTSSRDTFLRRVRQAVREGNRAGHAPELPSRGNVGYQGAGSDAVRCFADAFRAAVGNVHLVSDCETAAARIVELVQTVQARQVLLGCGGVLDALGLPERLASLGVGIVSVDGQPLGDAHFAADVAITGVDYLIAETGSLAMLARADNPRSFSLLPPVHIAVADSSQLLSDLFDLFGADVWGERPALPSCISLITGPSKTGDIELRLVTGVHGPGEVHVVLIGA